MQQVSCSRTDPVDAWLRTWNALSIEIFLRDPSRPFGNREDPAVLTDRSGDHEAGLVAVHNHRIEGWMRMGAPHPRRMERRTEAADAQVDPDDAVGEAFRAQKTGGCPKGSAAKNFDTQRIPTLQPRAVGARR